MTAAEQAAKIKNVSRACSAVGCLARNIGSKPIDACRERGCISPDYPVKAPKKDTDAT